MDLSGVYMKFKLKAFTKAIESFKYGMPDTAEIEINVNNEDIQESKICDCITITSTWQETPAKYDDNKNVSIVTQTLELFPESENRPFKIITIRTRDIG